LLPNLQVFCVPQGMRRNVGHADRLGNVGLAALNARGVDSGCRPGVNEQA
jgi:hypothetical protein